MVAAWKIKKEQKKKKRRVKGRREIVRARKKMGERGEKEETVQKWRQGRKKKR